MPAAEPDFGLEPVNIVADCRRPVPEKTAQAGRVGIDHLGIRHCTMSLATVAPEDSHLLHPAHERNLECACHTQAGLLPYPYRCCLAVPHCHDRCHHQPRSLRFVGNCDLENSRNLRVVHRVVVTGKAGWAARTSHDHSDNRPSCRIAGLIL